MIAIARAAGVPAQIYHLKAAGTSNWNKLDKVIAKVEAVLGEPVTKSSIENCLCSNITGRHPRFERVGRGRYRIAR